MKLKQFIKIYAMGSMLGAAITMFITFFIAFFSKHKAVLVNINTYGEANIEFILLTLTIITIVPTLYWLTVKGEKIYEY